MPFETVHETYVRQKRVKVCARCHRQLPETVKHRGAYNAGGSIAGSFGGSIVGSRVVGGLLGPVGALAGAIGGAMAGSRAGATASNSICDAVEATGGEVCPECRAAGTARAAGSTNWGGGRLGDGSEGGASQPSSAASRLRQRFTGGNADETAPSAALQPSGGFVAFAGAGHALGSAPAEPAQEGAAASKPRGGGAGCHVARGGGSAAAAAAARRHAGAQAGGGSAAGGIGGMQQSQQQQPAPAATEPDAERARRQMEEDEALARQLQEQFMLEEQQ